MTRRTKITLAAAGIVLLAAIALVLWWLRPKPAPLPNQPNIPTVGGLNATGVGTGPGATNTAPPLLTKEPQTQSTLTAIAVTFAERWGSYSNQANFETLRDARELMSARLRAAADAQIAAGAPKNAVFYGVTTRALGAQIITLDAAEASAQVLVSTQRTETTATGDQVTYTGLLLQLLNTADGWRVDTAEWQK